MIIREARSTDIEQIQRVRNSVRENRLSDPALVSDADCAEFIHIRGKGWVCETGEKVIGFAIADLKEENIWALFIDPEYEKMGIGRQLHDTMLDWYFGQGKEWVWLSTAPDTRAEKFYRRAGWQENGIYGKGEIRFEMRRGGWAMRE